MARNPQGLISAARAQFHAELLGGPLTQSADGVLSIADSGNAASKRIASAIASRLGTVRTAPKRPGQALGDEFEAAVTRFLQRTFLALTGVRPGRWHIDQGPGAIGQYEQYEHLLTLMQLVEAHPDVEAALGGDYLIKPDIVIAREPEPDEALNATSRIVDEMAPAKSPLRRANNPRRLLHASISCKWTIRSDRSQNSRTEALNLIRNRKGRVPHAVVVTAEPTPGRIASIALGTGDLDCVYHFALPELLAACAAEREEDGLDVLVTGKRLRDIADLPLDLAV